jgi:N-acetyl-anhydromuramyl-L-alanine amidase AmpD
VSALLIAGAAATLALLARRTGTGKPTVVQGGEERPVSGILVARPWPFLRTHSPLRRVDMFTVHWSGGTRSQGTYNTLRQRGLGAHFLIDNDGTIRQIADLSVQMWLTGTVNDRSVGVEVTNPYYLRAQDARRPRPVWTLGVRGSRDQHLGFFEEERRSLVALASAMCDFFRIPRVLPGDSAGNVATGTLPREALRGFRGVIGHYHENAGKIDPGTKVWEDFQAAGFRVQPV